MTYTLYYRSNEHPRTINTPRNARTNFSTVECTSERQAIFEYFKLCIQGKRPYQIIGSEIGKWPVDYMVCKDKDSDPYLCRVPSRGLPFCR